MKKIIMIISVIVSLLAADLTLTYTNFIKDSDYFSKNDFEITQYKHPDRVWDKVFFGNSAVISAYIEEQSDSGYINLGLDCGVMTDLRDMLKKRHVNIGSELVLGLNYLTFYDEFDTNPTYIWHKKIYEPYAYFERDRFYPIITRGFDNLLRGENPMPFTYLPQEKNVYHGALSDSALADSMARYERELYNLPIEKFEKNIAALDDVVRFCSARGIRVRAVWMPHNPKCEVPELTIKVHARAREILDNYGIELLDLEAALPAEYFFDTGHLNYDVGAPKFTEMIDQWL
ncbi:MAG: hypothetical protein J1F64_06815 [Oscillospiraceae bacterium]|nr:hypothetical protein [Oscillospiraceae bacterium]